MIQRRSRGNKQLATINGNLLHSNRRDGFKEDDPHHVAMNCEREGK